MGQQLTNLKYLADFDVEPVERRGTPRRVTAMRGEIVFVGIHTSCIVRNVSEGGARLELADVGQVPPAFDLHVSGLQPQACNVVWRSVRDLGIVFKD